MKRKTCFILLSLLLAVLLSACGKKTDATGLWNDALYQKDQAFGEGEKTLKVAVRVEDKSITFTLSTDAETVGEALVREGLIEGEQGDYGLYVKKVNGITADYDADQSYWAFYIDGEYAMSSVDLTTIEEGKEYALVYEK